MRLAGWLVFALVLAGIGNAQETVPDYRNPNLPIEQRVADLLARMTLEEKVDQLAPKQLREKMRDLFKNDSTVSPREAAALRNGVQKYTREKTRLGIPVIFFGEALHGYMAYDSTSFPQVLGLASTALIHMGARPHPDTGRVERDEALARQTLDLLALLKEKTTGNLSPEDERFFAALLTDLRLKLIGAAPP